jgi:hypothetical protein
MLYFFSFTHISLRFYLVVNSCLIPFSARFVFDWCVGCVMFFVLFLFCVFVRRRARGFYSFMESKVDIPRIKVGEVQTLETLVSEECLLLAKYLRCERKTWIPRIANLRC